MTLPIEYAMRTDPDGEYRWAERYEGESGWTYLRYGEQEDPAAIRSQLEFYRRTGVGIYARRRTQ